MNIGPFTTTEEAIAWGNEFAAASEQGAVMFDEKTVGHTAFSKNTAENHDMDNFVMDRIEQVYAVISTTKQSLSDLHQELNGFVLIDHSRTLLAAVFMLHSLEYELDDINTFLRPTDETYRAMKEMIASEKKANAKKK